MLAGSDACGEIHSGVSSATGHSPEFKARVAREASSARKTIEKIAADDAIHPIQVSQWKRQLLIGASELFTRGKQSRTITWWFSSNQSTGGGSNSVCSGFQGRTDLGLTKSHSFAQTHCNDRNLGRFQGGCGKLSR
jgi:putative transposase